MTVKECNVQFGGRDVEHLIIPATALWVTTADGDAASIEMTSGKLRLYCRGHLPQIVLIVLSQVLSLVESDIGNALMPEDKRKRWEGMHLPELPTTFHRGNDMHGVEIGNRCYLHVGTETEFFGAVVIETTGGNAAIRGHPMELASAFIQAAAEIVRQYAEKTTPLTDKPQPK